MHKVFEKVKEEFVKVLPPTIFFFIALHIVAIVRVLISKGGTFQPLDAASILVASLILGKAVLIADMLPGINMYPTKPLIYNVAWKTAIYLVVAGIIHYLERLYEFTKQAGSIAGGNDKLFAEMVWEHFWAVQIILFVLILMYCTARELVRVIGRDTVIRMFFGPEPLPQFR
jgi:hypothetical protein